MTLHSLDLSVPYKAQRNDPVPRRKQGVMGEGNWGGRGLQMTGLSLFGALVCPSAFSAAPRPTPSPLAQPPALLPRQLPLRGPPSHPPPPLASPAPLTASVPTSALRTCRRLSVLFPPSVSPSKSNHQVLIESDRLSLFPSLTLSPRLHTHPPCCPVVCSSHPGASPGWGEGRHASLPHTLESKPESPLSRRPPSLQAAQGADII